MRVADRYRAMRASGYPASTALMLARAERWLEDASGLEVVIRDDPEPWNGDSPRPFEVVGVCLVRPCPRHGVECPHADRVSSLWGIGLTGRAGADRAYLRAMAAELAWEVMPPCA